MSLLRFRPLLLLPAVAILIAAAILWGGVTLSERESFERVAQDRGDVGRLGQSIQEQLDALERRYLIHLESLCRGNLSDRFGLRDTIDGVVGVRQLSTLASDGRVDLHLIASGESEETADEKIPVPVFDRDDLPVGRPLPFYIDPSDFSAKTESGQSGWLPGEDHLFFFRPLSERRSVFLLIDSAAVTASTEQWIKKWLSDELTLYFHGEGALAVSLNNRFLATVGEFSGEQPDVILQLGSRFGNWQILFRDPRRRVVEYEREILVGSALLAVLVALAGGIAFFYLNRALHLAERRVSFVNHVSHELKTPLTNILLNTDLAADGATPAGKKRLAMVQEETRRLSRLIDNVLTYSQRGRAVPDLLVSPHAPGSLIDEVVARFRPSLERRGIDIVITGDTTARAFVNADAFAQILGNLLSNVEKYAASGGVALIEIEGTDREIVVRVSDAGPGIPRLERERIFRPFHRLNDHTTEGASGTGLGLAIARELAGRMAGSLRVMPGRTGPGAVFELRLPAAPDEKVIDFPDSRAS